MMIHTCWAARKGESTPELVAAWDEYTVDSYGSQEGFDEDCKKALDAIGSDLDTVRYIDIEINEDAVMDAFNSSMIDGKVHPA